MSDKEPTVNNCLDDLRMFRGLHPYDDTGNYNKGDGYFGRFIHNYYPKEVREEAERILKGQSNERR